uniref:Uncharacterized protein n=2 Tax=Clytia hemisphaerica TaxID=252671 RepID=A0A7M5XJZ3_9CNID
MEAYDSYLISVFRWLVNKDGRSCSNITELEETFPHIKNLQYEIEQCKALFWTGHTNSDLEVRPKLSIRLCTQYQAAKGSCPGHCNKLHLCPLNLLSPKFCKGPCRDSLSHNFDDKHNKDIIHNALPVSTSNFVKSIPVLLRSSLLRLCKMFQDTGQCDKIYCGYLHICLDYLKGKCTGICQLAEKSDQKKAIVHDFGRAHNRKVLLNFGYDAKCLSNKGELLHNLLLPKDDKENDCESVSSSISDLSTLSVSDYSTSGSMNTTSKDYQDFTTQIHKWIARRNGIHVKAELKCLAKQFPKAQDLLQTLKADNKMFWLRQISDVNYEVHVKVPVGLCEQYNKSINCEDRDCQKLHLCKKFLWSEKSCPDANACPFEHRINILHNSNILKKVFPNGYDDIMKMKVLRSSFPKICREFINDGCCTKPFCGYFHACPDFIRGSCKKTCNLAEKTGLPKKDSHFLRNYHNIQVMNIFYGDGKELKRDVVAPNILLNPNEDPNDVSINTQDLSSLSTQEPFDENLFESSEIAIVHKWMAQAKSLSCGIKKLSKQFKDIDNLLEKLQDNKNMFWVSENAEETYEIRQTAPIHLCKDFSDSELCSDNTCQKLHLCKKFIWSPTSCSNDENTCGYSHDVMSSHNKSVLAKVIPNTYNEDMKLKVVRASFPRICGSFLVDGTCIKPFCGYFHICQAFIEGTCPRTCILAEKSGLMKTTVHNFTLDHNKKVFRMFFDDGLNVCRDTVAPDILLKPEPVDKTDDLPSMDAKADPIPSLMSVETNFKEVQSSVLPKKSAYSVSTKPGKLTQALTSSVQFANTGAKPKRFSAADSLPNLTSTAYTTAPSSTVELPSKQLNVQLCKHYLNGNCKRKNCHSLHLCKELLMDQKTCPGEDCRYGFSHNPLDSHNDEIVRRANSTLSDDEVLKKLRKSFPRVCYHYQAQNCVKKCKKLHICLNFLQNSVCTFDGCDLSHDVFDDYNQAILDSHGSKFHEMEVDDVLANILFAKHEKEKEPSHVMFLKRLYDQILSSPKARLNLDLEIENLGTGVINDLKTTGKYKNHFRVCYINGYDYIYVCPKDVKLCNGHFFNKKKPCQKVDCSGFHLCRNYITVINGCSNSGCIANHGFNDKHERKLLKKHHLEELSEHQLKVLFSHRYPIVCPKYQSGNCKSADQCDDIHVCLSFLRGNCKDYIQCSLQHEEGLKSEQANRIAKEYHVPEKELRSSLMFSRKRTTIQVFEKTTKVIKERVNLETNTIDVNETKDCSIPPSTQPLPGAFSPTNQAFGTSLSNINPILPMAPTSPGPFGPTPFGVCTPANGIPIPPPSSGESRVQGLLGPGYILPPSSMKPMPPQQSLLKPLPATPFVINQGKFNFDNKDTSILEWETTEKPVKRQAPKPPTVQPLAQEISATKPLPVLPLETSEAVGKESLAQSRPNIKPSTVIEIDLKQPQSIPTHEDRKQSSTTGFTGFDTTTKLTQEWEPPSELDVFKYIIQCRNAHVKIKKNTICAHFFQSKLLLCLNWLKNHPDTFRLTRNKKEVFLCVKDIKLCVNYWSNAGCLGDCGLFHICKESLFDISHSAISCGKHHDFSSAHNKGIIGKFSLEPLNAPQLKCLLKNTLPSVCEEYLKNRCTDLQQCENIHICGDFVNGECRKHSALCSFRHEEALSDNHADEIMKLFHISDTSLLKKSLVYFKPKSEEKKKQEFLQQPTFNFLKDEAICVKYVDDVCDKDETCSLLHPKNRTPYLWQHKKPIETSWKSFPNNLNVEIEKAFCDPMQSRYDFADKASYIKFDESSKITAFYMNQNVEVRRLSTRTSLCMPKGSYTTWKWYWKENSGKWTEYTGKVTSDNLEYDFVYQNHLTHKTFTIGEYNYKLDFTTMQQHNLGPVYFTKRNVIRRPVFVSA